MEVLILRDEQTQWTSISDPDSRRSVYARVRLARSESLDDGLESSRSFEESRFGTGRLSEEYYRDNGSEFASRITEAWAMEHEVQLYVSFARAYRWRMVQVKSMAFLQSRVNRLSI